MLILDIMQDDKLKQNITNGILLTNITELLASSVEYEEYMNDELREQRLLIINNLISEKERDHIEIKLLPGKYKIDHELYDYLVSHNIYDKYYNACINCLELPYKSENILHRNSIFTYRDAYHQLLYGSEDHLMSIIIRWELWDIDDSIIAVRDFFGLSNNFCIEEIKKKIENEAKLR